MSFYVLLVFFLMLVGGGLHAHAAAPTKAEIRDAMAVAAQAQGRDAVIDLAEQFAVRYGREAVAPIVDVILEWQDDMRDQGFVLYALVLIHDPTGEKGLQMAAMSSVGFSVAIAAIASPRDDAAREALVRLATGQYPSKTVGQTSVSYSCGFLRSFGSDGIKPKIEKALQAENTPYRAHQLALIASIDYRQHLKDETELKAYLDFERRLWLALATTSKAYVGMFMTYDEAAWKLGRHWKTVDERFASRTLSHPHSSDVERRVIMALAGSSGLVALRQEVTAIAATDSADAPYARHYLEELDKRAASQRMPSTRP